MRTLNVFNPEIIEHRRHLPLAPNGACGTVKRLPRAWHNRKFYSVLVLRSWLKGLPLGTILRTQFGFLVKESPVPPTVDIELTNYCNLRCCYCTSPMRLRPQGFMTGETLRNLVQQIRAAKIKRVAIIGNGEPTLHPDFPRFIQELAGATVWLELTSNGQWTDQHIVPAILKAPVGFLTISLDGVREGYERSRIGGKFDNLTNNLRMLRKIKRECRSSTIIHVRVMLRPSQLAAEEDLVSFYRGHADTVQVQHVVDCNGLDSDVYAPRCNPGSYPRCNVPFKKLDVHWDGNVPLCGYSEIQTGRPEGLLLGNINNLSLIDLWNSALLEQYRSGHRLRKTELMPICNGCPGN